VVVVRTGSKNKTSNSGKKQTLSALILVSIMIFSTQMYTFQNFDTDQNLSEREISPNKTTIQQSSENSDEPNGQQSQSQEFNPFNHPIFSNPSYHDPASYYGKVSDISALTAFPGYEFYLEETNTDDHDNDGIDDLNDLDDDNDGLNDLIERFDGCFGTHPFDHDNDGLQDDVDWDDDNDGILEGPIDYTQGNDPKNVSSDRYISSTTIHPWTGLEVGTAYLVDQNPFDHDNDGVPDEDIDGSGKGTYDEDDDNDARLDQFTWPCDFDGDGIQDYFDIDDDNDGLIDLWDEHPWDSDKTGNITTSGVSWEAAVLWASNQQHEISMTALGLSVSELE